MKVCSLKNHFSTHPLTHPQTSSDSYGGPERILLSGIQSHKLGDHETGSLPHPRSRLAAGTHRQAHTSQLDQGQHRRGNSKHPRGRREWTQKARTPPREQSAGTADGALTAAGEGGAVLQTVSRAGKSGAGASET